MSRRGKRHGSATADYPGWVWMLFGLAIGLSVALAIYVNARNARVAAKPPPPSQAEAPSVAAAPAEKPAPQTKEPGQPPPQRFEFYDMLPNFEVIIPEREADVSTDTEKSAVVEPGTYVLQAGSFTEYADADRRRAQLALQGIESTIQRVTIDDKTYHRVRIGPIDDLDRLNMLRTRLRQADIDVLRIRMGD